MVQASECKEVEGRTACRRTIQFMENEITDCKCPGNSDGQLFRVVRPCLNLFDGITVDTAILASAVGDVVEFMQRCVES